MPPDERLRQFAEGWLARARGILALAKQPKPTEAFWEDKCFDAQQAAEKAVKAVLAVRGIDFPKSHDIAELLALLSPADVPDELWSADSLTEFAAVTRYPGRPPPVSEAEFHAALALAEQVVLWAEALIRVG